MQNVRSVAYVYANRMFGQMTVSLGKLSCSASIDSLVVLGRFSDKKNTVRSVEKNWLPSSTTRVRLNVHSMVGLGHAIIGQVTLGCLASIKYCWSNPLAKTGDR